MNDGLSISMFKKIINWFKKKPKIKLKNGWKIEFYFPRKNIILYSNNFEKPKLKNKTNFESLTISLAKLSDQHDMYYFLNWMLDGYMIDIKATLNMDNQKVASWILNNVYLIEYNLAQQPLLIDMLQIRYVTAHFSKYKTL